MNERIIVSTVSNPDPMAIQRFKKDIKSYMKKGYKIKGSLIIKPDGSIEQHLIK